MSHVDERLLSNADEDNSDSSPVFSGAMFMFRLGGMGNDSVGWVGAALKHSPKM